MGLFSRSRSVKPTSPPSSVMFPNAHSPSSSSSSPSDHKPDAPNASAPASAPTPADCAQLAHALGVALPPPPRPDADPAMYLRSIYAVRERSLLVLEMAKKNHLRHFDVDMSQFATTARFVVSIIKRDYHPDYASIPPHGRWQHFDVGGRPRVDQLLATWPRSIDRHERTRRLIDLFLVSVLLDAGAGTRWQYRSKESGKVYKRSEGLAVASLEMFKLGLFSTDPAEPCRADGPALRALTRDQLARGLQVTVDNPLDGLDGRAALLARLGDALLHDPAVWGPDARPGNLLDYLISHPTTQIAGVPVVPLPTLWDTLMASLSPIWPVSRTHIDGVPLGDAWPCDVLPRDPARPSAHIVPFHKLTQWLTYSLMVPMQRLAHVHFVGTELLTGLPEYRNGGLLIDTGLLTLKDADARRGLAHYQRNATRAGQPNCEVVPLFTADDDVIVEWRAVTVGFLDLLRDEVNRQLGVSLSLAQVLEAGTWKGGREIAEVSRPNTREPPIMILSDGTVF